MPIFLCGYYLVLSEKYILNVIDQLFYVKFHYIKRMNPNNRNSSIELLRIICMYFVLIGHIFFHGAHSKVPNANYILAFGISINVFMLISGYYGIRLKIKSLLNMVGMVMFYAVVSTGLNYLFMGRVHLLGAISGLFPVSHNAYYWFATCYIFLMLFSPLVNKGLEGLNQKQFLWILVSLIYMNCISGWLFRNDYINSTGFTTMQLIFMYVIGYACKRLEIPMRIGIKPLIIIYLITAVLSIIQGQIPYIRGLGLYNNPLNVLKSIAIFCIFLKFNIHSKWVNQVAKCVFACYLIQEGMLGQTIYKLQYEFWKQTQDVLTFWGFAISCTIAIFIVALIIEPIRRKYMDRLIDGIYKHWHLKRIDIVKYSTYFYMY